MSGAVQRTLTDRPCPCRGDTMADKTTAPPPPPPPTTTTTATTATSRTAAPLQSGGGGSGSESLHPRPSVKRNACVVQLDGCRYTISE